MMKVLEEIFEEAMNYYADNDNYDALKALQSVYIMIIQRKESNG
jgi:hypothetical protein